jgi:hypothetical protein
MLFYGLTEPEVFAYLAWADRRASLLDDPRWARTWHIGTDEYERAALEAARLITDRLARKDT